MKKCKKCGSKKIMQFAERIDHKTIEMEYECQNCGYSYKELDTFNFLKLETGKNET